MTQQKILLFGAGKSATVLIDYLINEAELNNWQVIVADADLQLALMKTKKSKPASPQKKSCPHIFTS